MMSATTHSRRRFLGASSVALGGFLLGKGTLAAPTLTPTKSPSHRIQTHGIAPLEIRLTPSVIWDYDSAGFLYALDRANNRLTKFDTTGDQILWQWGGPDALGRRQLNGPAAIAIDPRGRVYVADLGNHRVLVLSQKQGRVVDIIQSGKRQGLNSPQDLALANGLLYVADTLNHEIDIYSREGRFRSSFGAQGFNYDDLNGPTSLAVGESGDLFVIDKGNASIKVFNHTGVLLDVYDGARLGGIPNFNPAYLALGPDGILYVADRLGGRLAVLTQRGLLLDVIVLTLPDGSIAQPRYLGFAPDGSLIVSANSALPPAGVHHVPPAA